MSHCASSQFTFGAILRKHVVQQRSEKRIQHVGGKRLHDDRLLVHRRVAGSMGGDVRCDGVNVRVRFN